MKKLLLSVAVLGFITLASSSCKKDWNCDCTIEGDNYKFEINDATKSDAEEACSEVEDTYKLYEFDAKCTLSAK
jgi:hypothetical protein